LGEKKNRTRERRVPFLTHEGGKEGNNLTKKGTKKKRKKEVSKSKTRRERPIRERGLAREKQAQMVEGLRE